MTHAIFVDRVRGSKDCVLTLQHEGIKIFDKIPCATGQYPYLDNEAEDWIHDKGGTPYGKWWLSTKKEILQMDPIGTPFYIISSQKGSRLLINPKNPKQQRGDAGLHLENKFPGTAGCTAAKNDTPVRECTAWALFAYLDHLHKYEPYIPYEVL